MNIETVREEKEGAAHVIKTCRDCAEIIEEYIGDSKGRQMSYSQSGICACNRKSGRPVV